MIRYKQNSIKQTDKFKFSADPVWPHLLRIIFVLTLAYLLLPAIN